MSKEDMLLKRGIGILAVLIPLIFFLLPYLITQCSTLWYFDDATGVMGDTIGGITSPVVGFVGAILTFAAFYIQYKANLDQRKAIKTQEDQIAESQFENRFFELMRLHRDNVSEISLSDQSGKKVFVLFIREFRAILTHVKKVCKENDYLLSIERKINLSYLIFFYGTGPNSSRILKAALNGFDSNVIETVITEFDSHILKEHIRDKLKFSYVPFEGHQSRLGHYFRHLYQTITYVDESKLSIEKYDYIKILRAQLSNHEQALLFFNSLSEIGKNWKEKGLLSDYHFIKNIPKDFIDPNEEIDVKLCYPKIKFEFEEV